MSTTPTESTYAMMNWDWVTTTGSNVLMVILSGIGIYAVLLLFTRIAGLRSFSKLSSFDFAITVAMGSLVAMTLLTEDPPLIQSIVGLGVLFGVQYVVSMLRRHTRIVPWLIDNRPVLLMAGPEIIHENMTRVRMSDADLMCKLRMAGVTHTEQVLAVVLETTGDVSVLKSDPDRPGLDPGIFEDVDDGDRLRGVVDAVRPQL